MHANILNIIVHYFPIAVRQVSYIISEHISEGDSHSLLKTILLLLFY